MKIPGFTAEKSLTIARNGVEISRSIAMPVMAGTQYARGVVPAIFSVCAIDEGGARRGLCCADYGAGVGCYDCFSC